MEDGYLGLTNRGIKMAKSKLDTLKELYGNSPFEADLIIKGDDMMILSNKLITEEDYNAISKKDVKFVSQN